MNILVIVELYSHRNKSGGEIYLHHLLKKMKTYLKANITVLIPNQEEDKKFEYEEIVIFESKDKIEKLYSNFDSCDLIITQLFLSVKVIKTALKKKKEVMWILHGFHESFEKLMKEDKVIKIFNSENVLKQFQAKVKKQIQNFNILYPYTDFLTLKEYKSKEIYRREYITFINPCDNKGADVVIKLAKRNKDKKFLIVEGGYGLEEQKNYLSIFRTLPNCHIIKNTKNILEDIYLKTKIILMPSLYESYGMVSSEASCLGIPIIINRNCEGLKENLGEFTLGGYNKEAESYNKVLESLCIKENRFMWSNYFFDKAEERYEEVDFQLNNFMEERFTIINNNNSKI